jgi:beta-galactosidase
LSAVSRVTYRDGRLIVDGAPRLVRAVDVQYYRLRRAVWQDRLETLARGGCDTVTFYVPWRHHLVGWDAGRQRFDFTGGTAPERDVVGFIRQIGELGLLAVAKPGPFVHSELNIGGLPDLASPSFRSGLEPVRRHDGEPLAWGYDGALLPSPEDPGFDDLARAWLEAAGAALRPFAAPAGPIVLVQLNDETLYCTANAPPWSFGYDAPCAARYRALLAERYGGVAGYNAAHGTAHASLTDVAPPALPTGPPAGPRSAGEALSLADWGELQWRLRRDSYARYKRWLDLPVPHISNHAGITPPIEENVPGAGPEAVPDAERPFRHLYPEWWLAQNRIEADLDVCAYGFISWLGVAAYDVPDPRSVETSRPCDPNRVLDRWWSTALRRPGINMEENWGFAKLYHPFSKHPIVPFYQSLASIAAGATGYVVFCGVQHDHWPDELDRVTKRQHPTFPSDAPLRADGSTTPMYEAMALLNRWLTAEGDGLLGAELRRDAVWLAYAPWAAVSSWVPDHTWWRAPDREVPRSGLLYERFAASLFAEGFVPGLVDLGAVDLDELLRTPVCAVRFGFFMDEASQRKLLTYVEAGGTLVCAGAPPTDDDRLRPCGLIADVVRTGATTAHGAGRIVHVQGAPFADGRAAALLGALRRTPAVRCTSGVRALVHTGVERRWLFFFGQRHGPGPHAERVELPGLGALTLTIGPKTCGAVRLEQGRIGSALIKGVNEVEDTCAEVALRWGEDEVRHSGDLVAFYD